MIEASNTQTGHRIFLKSKTNKVHTANLRQECHNSEFGIFELLV